MDLVNTCALVCRVTALILLIYAMILSSKILSSCHFISAVSTNNETHGVGILSFETDKQECIPHNDFIKEHYNGTEMTAKVGGYLAPALASVVVLWLLAECCKKNGCWSGKCIPTLLMVGCVVGQSLTFILFQSQLFCDNEDIKTCQMGSAAFTSVQACGVYVVTLTLYFWAPNPKPLSNLAVGMGMMGANSSAGNTTASSSNSSKKEKKSKPDEGEEYTREMYEQRRKEKKIKSRGVSGRKKKEIFNDLNGKSDQSASARKEDEYDESQIILYDPETAQREDEKKKSGRGSPQPRYDDYVDEPDGMDWSAYSPNEREAYYQRKRSTKKQREREKKEQEMRKLREREEMYRDEKDRRHRDLPPSDDDETFQSEYTKDQYDRIDDQYDRNGRYDNRDRGYNRSDRHEDSYRSSDYGYGKHERYGKHNESYYDDSYRSYRSGDRRGSYNDYDDSYSYRSGQDDFSAYDSRAGDAYFDQSTTDDMYNEGGESARGDDYSYGYDSRAGDYYESPHSRRSDRGGYYS